MNKMSLPFTDKDLETEAYRDECDKLSALEAQNNHTSWGRWYIDDGMLCTWVVFPANEYMPVRKCYIYDFSIECVSQGRSEDWLRQLSEKKWMGEKGLKDLQRAFKYIAKHN